MDVPSARRATRGAATIRSRRPSIRCAARGATTTTRRGGWCARLGTGHGSGDLGNHTGYRQGDPDYERNINIVHDAAIKAGVRLCGPLAWRDRPDYTCFQAGSETLAIANGAKADLGPLANTQPVPEVGPWAKK